MRADCNGIGMTSQRTRDRLIATLREMGIESGAVLDVMRSIPRHLFVDEALATRAYENVPLPIGYNQTISQPYIVARMTEALVSGRQLNNVLEIGAGCGYQSAVIAQFAEQVYSVERINGLLTQARERFHRLGYHNIRARHADGNGGWPEQAPFDGIIVAAAPLGIPRALLDQLAMAGRLIIPVGAPDEQKLLLVTRAEDGFKHEHIDAVSFVPMLGGTDMR